MANKLLRGLAVAAGTGLAMGRGGKRQQVLPASDIASDDIQALEALLDRLDRIEERVSAIETSMQPAPDPRPELTSLFEQRLTEVSAAISGMVETLLAARIEDLRTQMQAVTEQLLEKAILEQSGAISILSERANQTDANMQRLISAMERLCERPDLVGKEPAPVDEPVDSNAPFSRHLSEAINRQL